jgi:tRNA(Ile)-lysidine synthase
MDLLDLNEVKQLLNDSKKCVIGVSGGIDSISLLHWFAQNRLHFNCEIQAIHVDHGIHPDSNHWAKFVQDECKRVGIPIVSKRVELTGLGNNLEYAARKARYQVFCSSGADTIILAHHANDQCETFLLKLFRGSGIRGLKSMQQVSTCWYDHRIKVVRPMLKSTKTTIEMWAEEQGITGILDPSNHDNRYDRNFLRNKIWPQILDRFGVADVNTMRSIQHIEEAWELTSQLADIDINSVRLSDNSLDWVKTQELGYLRIKNMILRLLGQEEVYSFSVGQVEQFARGLLSANMDNRNQLVTKNLILTKVGKRIVLERVIQKAA